MNGNMKVEMLRSWFWMTLDMTGKIVLALCPFPRCSKGNTRLRSHVEWDGAGPDVGNCFRSGGKVGFVKQYFELRYGVSVFRTDPGKLFQRSSAILGVPARPVLIASEMPLTCSNSCMTYAR